MSIHDSFADINERLNQGDYAAAAEVFHRFATRLIGMARHRLDQRVRRKVDPEDIVQSVFRSFFTRHAEGRFELASWDELWGLLTRITLRKCGRRVGNLRAACRDIRREQAPPIAADSDHEIWEALTRQPTPEEAALLSDTVDELMRGLDDREQQILSMRCRDTSFKKSVTRSADQNAPCIG